MNSAPFYTVTYGARFSYKTVVHKAGCSYLRRASNAHPRSRNPLDDDRFNNYTPCSRCNPRASSWDEKVQDQEAKQS